MLIKQFGGQCEHQQQTKLVNLIKACINEIKVIAKNKVANK
jgi:hypothetical protein